MAPEAAVRLCGYAPHRPRNRGALAAALTARSAGNMPYGLRQTTTGCRATAPIWDRKRRNKVQLVSPLTRTKKRQTLPSRTTDRSAQMATSFSIRLANVWGRKEFWEAAESAAMLQPRIGIHMTGPVWEQQTPNAQSGYGRGFYLSAAISRNGMENSRLPVSSFTSKKQEWEE